MHRKKDCLLGWSFEHEPFLRASLRYSFYRGNLSPINSFGTKISEQVTCIWLLFVLKNGTIGKKQNKTKRNETKQGAKGYCSNPQMLNLLPTLARNLNKDEIDDSENVIWKMKLDVSAIICRLFQFLWLAKWVHSILESNWNERFGDGKEKQIVAKSPHRPHND